MNRLHRGRARMFSSSGKRSGIELSHSADYWPLTIIPSTSTPKRLRLRVNRVFPLGNGGSAARPGCPS